MIWRKAKRRHYPPWCGGDNLALTWGLIGPQAMVWAEAAGRHGQRNMWCEWWNRGRNKGGKSIVAYGTFSTLVDIESTSVSGPTLNSYLGFGNTQLFVGDVLLILLLLNIILNRNLKLWFFWRFSIIFTKFCFCVTLFCYVKNNKKKETGFCT